MAILVLAAIGKGLREDKGLVWLSTASGQLIAILFGGPLAGTAIGNIVVGVALWPWFLVGEAVFFIPGAAFVAYRNLLKDS